MYNQLEPFLSSIQYELGRKALAYVMLLDVPPTITTREAYDKGILRTQGEKSLLRTKDIKN